MNYLLDIFALFVICRFSLNFASLVFYLSEKVTCQWLHLAFNTTRITFPAAGYRRFHFFVYNLLVTSPSFIRIQFKTLKLVCVISSLQFSSRLIEVILKQFLNYSAEENPWCIFFPGALNKFILSTLMMGKKLWYVVWQFWLGSFWIDNNKINEVNVFLYFGVFYVAFIM